MSKLKKSKYTFTVTGLNINKLNQKYHIKNNSIKKNNTTCLKLLEKNHTISFLDESKRSHNCYLSMININKIDLKNNNYSCFWCRHSFNNLPIGCPIKYIPNEVTKTYYSNISKDNYTIKQKITSNRKDNIENNNELNLSKGDYYHTDGIFCSFNCCKSFINDNKHKRMYDYSDILLIKIYNKIFDLNCTSISLAPHWRVLKKYGGNLDINEFRNSFNKIEYEYHGNANYHDKFLPIINYFEEKIKF
jgi:hypothetical protein